MIWSSVIPTSFKCWQKRLKSRYDLPQRLTPVTTFIIPLCLLSMSFFRWISRFITIIVYFFFVNTQFLLAKIHRIIETGKQFTYFFCVNTHFFVCIAHNKGLCCHKSWIQNISSIRKMSIVFSIEDEYYRFLRNYLWVGCDIYHPCSINISFKMDAVGRSSLFVYWFMCFENNT